MCRNVVVSCEHAANRVPGSLAGLFDSRRHLLASHRGYDAGARELARRLARSLQAPLRSFTVSRLVIDANRSETHGSLFSPCMRLCPAGQKERLIRRHYQPYRKGLEHLVRQSIERAGPVVHIAVHTFTPVLRGERRAADIGLLYDPARTAERRLAAAWRDHLMRSGTQLRVRRNYPYRGSSDGITAWLRRIFPGHLYAGIELEVSQRFLRRGAQQWAALQLLLARTARAALE